MRANRFATVPRRLALGLTAAVTVLGLAATTGCDDRGGTSDLSTETQSQDYAQQVNKLEFDLAAGDITVSSQDATGVAVSRKLQWKTDKPKITEEVSGQTLRISVDCPDDQENCAVHYTVKAPAGVAVIAKTTAGNVVLNDITGDLDVNTDAGNTTVKNAVGKLRVHTVSGDVNATGLKSTDVAVTTESGKQTIRFAAAPNLVEATAEAGDIEVAVPKADGGYQVKANTKDGTRTIDVTQDADSSRSISVTTTSGDVDVVNA
ncbi:hypothetical protein Cme02nite_75830 [Catellatospora methionotrophica]|uniref:DUF4097 domain-containing protein n=1 Tax=Catellatospora methionotrophica TaxID=121620 RepID=A0A8J3LPV2_9ACTN|nr:DUF4097 family beta strand repeat-containing protein [Catellatospora methionotrophica]GIG19251.1 hypothetical protein Cme02nite_75830 [Catellatospora methionotrophica]